MTPAYIGPPQRRLFVFSHPPQSPGRAAVLLCPPLGHEMVRAHRLLRVLAERLARSGIHVLRFDPYGAGDSMGEDDDLDLDGWCKDVRTAHQFLAEQSAAHRIVWLGLRLGATVCAMAAKRGAPHRLLLCDPIVDGRRYLEELRLRHVQTLDASLGVPPSPRASAVAMADASAFRDEALGTRLSLSLRRQLESLDGSALIAGLPPGSTVVSNPANPAGIQDGMSTPAQLRIVKAAESVDWLSDLTEDGTLLPGKLSAQLMKEVNDACA